MTSSWTCLWRCTAGSHRICISLWGITLSLGVLCNIGYPSETHLKLKSREISFVNNIRVYNSIVLIFLHRAQLYHGRALCKVLQYRILYHIFPCVWSMWYDFSLWREFTELFFTIEDKIPFQSLVHISNNTLKSIYIKRTVYICVYWCQLLFYIKGSIGIFLDCFHKQGELPQLFFPRSIPYRCIHVDALGESYRRDRC